MKYSGEASAAPLPRVNWGPLEPGDSAPLARLVRGLLAVLSIFAFVAFGSLSL